MLMLEPVLHRARKVVWFGTGCNAQLTGYIHKTSTGTIAGFVRTALHRCCRDEFHNEDDKSVVEYHEDDDK